jgi:hypothetical protein
MKRSCQHQTTGFDRPERTHNCENASNHGPTAQVTQHIDFVWKDEILAEPFFA